MIHLYLLTQFFFQNLSGISLKNFSDLSFMLQPKFFPPVPTVCILTTTLPVYTVLLRKPACFPYVRGCLFPALGLPVIHVGVKWSVAFQGKSPNHPSTQWKWDAQFWFFPHTLLPRSTIVLMVPRSHSSFWQSFMVVWETSGSFFSLCVCAYMYMYIYTMHIYIHIYAFLWLK
jgi:hypothetical protein